MKRIALVCFLLSLTKSYATENEQQLIRMENKIDHLVRMVKELPKETGYSNIKIVSYVLIGCLAKLNSQDNNHTDKLSLCEKCRTVPLNDLKEDCQKISSDFNEKCFEVLTNQYYSTEHKLELSEACKTFTFVCPAR